MDIQGNARLQVLYREVNERIRALEASWGETPSLQVLCECGRGCEERLAVPTAAFDRARQDPTRFLVAPAHLASDVDQLVEDHGSWLLVEAIGVAAEIARRGRA